MTDNDLTISAHLLTQTLFSHPEKCGCEGGEGGVCIYIILIIYIYIYLYYTSTYVKQFTRKNHARKLRVNYLIAKRAGR